ncbi:biotin--[acetyl-CoA-carboxylase] ligase [Prolixibacteraceae bacterium JC049]|nr:biotin--[acetyl-CoA-carboxylase] ligase [Prolixibacteraceae bacterium JC049]
MNIIGNNIILLDQIDSTNNYAMQQSTEQELIDGTVFLADDQTAGRGQGTNFWESEPKANLTFSVVIYPRFLEIMDQFMISKIVTLGLVQWLDLSLQNVTIKWPNDIYVGQKKIAGILIENSLAGATLNKSVIGIGFNVNQTLFKSKAPNPISLKMLTQKSWDRHEVLKAICLHMDQWYSKLREGQIEEINKAFENRMMGINQWATFCAEEEVFEAKVSGVNEIGQLVLELNDGSVLAFHNKEVQYVIGSLKV